MIFSKIFRLAMITAIVTAFCSLIVPSESSAEDVWIYSDGDFSYYLTTEKISVDNVQPTYRGLVKVLHNGKYDNFQNYGFELRNGVVVGYMYSRSNGYWDFAGPISSTHPIFNAVWQAMKPYLKQQGVSNVDAWN